MNQIMINAAEWLAVQDRLDTLKRENELLRKQLALAEERIKALVDEVGFAENGYPTRSTNGRIIKI